MTRRQMKWAMDHDWFMGYQFVNDKYIIVCRPSYEGEDIQRFTDWQELRAWAGY